MPRDTDSVDPDRAVVEGVLRRAEYDALLQEYFSLVSKKAALEADNREAPADGDHDPLGERIDSLEADLDDALADLSPGEAYAVAVYGTRDEDRTPPVSSARPRPGSPNQTPR